MNFQHLALRIHAQVYERTDGLVGHRMLGVPTLLLRTTGRRTGVTRTNALVYASDGGRYLVVPSNGGADRPRPGCTTCAHLPTSRSRSAASAGRRGPR